MSNDEGLNIWVGDLDSYINVDFPIEDDDESVHVPTKLERQKELERERIRKETQKLDLEPEVENISLFSGKCITLNHLLSRGLTLGQWHWAKHDAEKALGDAKRTSELDRLFVIKINAMGRRYAVNRYAQWEGLSFSTALTATFPHGIRALLHQYIAREISLGNIPKGSTIQEALHQANNMPRMIWRTYPFTAYERTGIVRQALHKFAVLARGDEGHLCLNKESMRIILSLCRLNFLVSESNVNRIKDFKELDRLYATARTDSQREIKHDQVITGQYIKNWKLQHLHPLSFFFPYSIRNSIKRGIQHAPIDRCCTVNEIALIYCGMELMRENAKGRRSPK